MIIPQYRAGCPHVTHPSATKNFEQARHSSFDLHVLSTPPAFILSQDQTLDFLVYLLSYMLTRYQCWSLMLKIRLTLFVNWISLINLLYDLFFILSNYKSKKINKGLFVLDYAISSICLVLTYLVFMVRLLHIFLTALVVYHIFFLLSTTILYFFLFFYIFYLYILLFIIIIFLKKKFYTCILQTS